MTQKSSTERNQSNTGSSTSQSSQASIGDTVQDVTGQAKEKAGQVAGQAREQVSSRLSGQKDRTAEGLTGVAQALRQTGQTLRDQDQTGMTSYIDNAANQVERVSNYLRGRDVGELVDDVERFARRQPGLFLGGAFVLGALGVRFLKSSRGNLPSSNQYPPGGGQPYSSYSGVGYGRTVQPATDYGTTGTSNYGTGTTGTTGASTYGTTGTSSYGAGTTDTTGTSNYGTGTTGTTGTSNTGRNREER